MSSFWSALGLVFVAELGDKTQLVALGFGARYRLRLVLVGIGLAYLATNLVSVVIGALLGAALPGTVVQVVGGVLFLGFAAWTLSGDDEGGDNELQLAEGGRTRESSAVANRSSVAVVASVAGAMFVAELGDKTMLATATLASTQNPVWVWLGATVGIFASGALGAVAGRAVGHRIPDRMVRVGAAILFAAFGVVLLVAALQ